MKYITIDDFLDLYIKTRQRGLSFILSKLSLINIKRTKSSFNVLNIESSNWWIVPAIRERWNKSITGNINIDYEEYISNEVFHNYTSFKILSIGSGICSHEIKLAELNPHWNIMCIDISDNLLNKAQEIANNKKLQNISFHNENIYTYNLLNNYYDAVLFNSSLHHFKNIEEFILVNVIKKLKPKGKLIINEYVGPNRLQFEKKQLIEINNCIQLIDKKYRKIYKTNIFKRKYFGSGIIRMIIADPSECVDSKNIIPTIHKYFNVISEKSLGGNLLMSSLKHISHHFVEIDKERQEILEAVFECEDNYLLTNKSDFVFGIYELSSTKST